MTAHAIASTLDGSLQRLAGLAFDMHQDRAIARQEAAYEQRERNLSAVGKVAARVQSDANRIAALQAEVARLREENNGWRVRALGAEGKLARMAAAIRSMRSAA
ncbi:hypothetical protein [Methylobacterium brachiatum]|jgi:hypothetical protein|uniref:hypothetical protein n=1 Tax=Methylobacterium brachiatum TaxID=269660 RepID=UPI0024496AE5|nr:hypothetical protein [Methylobacterium brachiatum]MDH2309469.1 hypothetical protein [Methylobacterium brachiatum]